MLSILNASAFADASRRTVRMGRGVLPRGNKLRGLKSNAKGDKNKSVGDNTWAHAMLDFVGDAVLSTDTEARITYMNRAAETLSEISRHEATGKPLQDIFRVIDGKTRKIRTNIAQQVMDAACPFELRNGALLVTPNGRELAIEDAAMPLYDESGEVIGAVVKFHDSRYSAETTAKMLHMAQRDSLTGLLNRYAFAERFEQSAGLALRHQKKMVLLFIDLDNFKQLNDTLGHRAGDEILTALGQRLQGCVRNTDHVGRHGGDEFVVLLSDLEHHTHAFAVVDKVREAACELLRLIGQEASVTLSIGVSLFPDNGLTLDTLLPHADAAMYRVKASNRQNRGPMPEHSRQ